MGKGDKKSKRGKINIGSYGVRRQKKKTKPFVAEKAVVEIPVVKEKVAVKKQEVAEVQAVVVEEKVKKVKKVAEPKAEITEEKPKAKKTTKKVKEDSDQKELFTEEK